MQLHPCWLPLPAGERSKQALQAKIGKAAVQCEQASPALLLLPLLLCLHQAAEAQTAWHNCPPVTAAACLLNRLPV
jgi:hypothetical protein